jgi:hypothetical protein
VLTIEFALVTQFCRHENFDPNSAKTKTIFVVMQLILTLLSLLPIQVHCNGASYYVRHRVMTWGKVPGADGSEMWNGLRR